MKKVLFIDRDGTLVLEPNDYQLDAFEKLTFAPGVFTWLGKIAKELDYELVLVSNQDGLGTDSFPMADFLPVHQLIIKTFENEGIIFNSEHIDRSFPEENLPTRKPGIDMLKRFLSSNYDVTNSFVIGDRYTDIELAKNLGCKGILIQFDGRFSESNNTKVSSDSLATSCTKWEEIYRFLSIQERKSRLIRNTKETRITVELDLEGAGYGKIDTGLPFFDHMLDQIARHAGIDLNISTKGDLEVDEHHTIEDTALALGASIRAALGKKTGIERYGFQLPMDDCLANCSLDFGGRPWLVWEVDFKRESIGHIPTEMWVHFFKSFTDAAQCNLNISASGSNEHHKIESIFKSFAKAIKMAIKKDFTKSDIPSTKGTL